MTGATWKTEVSIGFAIVWVYLCTEGKQVKPQVKQRLVLDNVTDCGILSDYVEYNCSLVSTTIQEQVFRLEVNFKKKVDAAGGTMELYKCEFRSLDKCEHYTTFEIDNICETLKNPMFQKFIPASKPPAFCPLQGKYELANGTMNTDDLLKGAIAASGLYYPWDYFAAKLNIYEMETKKNIVCIHMQGYYRNYRVRQP